MNQLCFCHSIIFKTNFQPNQDINKGNFLTVNRLRKNQSHFFLSKKKLENNSCRPNTNTCIQQKMNINNFSSDDNSLFENISKDGGVLKSIIKEGRGPLIENGFDVKLNYQGKLSDGRVFDSSLTRKKPFSFVVGEQKVISGWEVGIKSMKMGEKAKFLISSKYGYKKKGIPPIIPPNADLIFEIEIIDVIEKNEIDSKQIGQTQTKEISSSSELLQKKNDLTNSFSSEKFFFISPFGSQTGEKAPWWLDPNITFFLIFLLITSLFALVYSLGGINHSFDNPSSILDSEEYM